MGRTITVVSLLLIVGGAVAQDAPQPAGGITVFAKVDLDAGENPFKAAGGGKVEVVDAADGAGKVLHVTRLRETGYWGATLPLAAEGTVGLKIGILVRSKGALTMPVNFFDSLRSDNTTPTAAARMHNAGWETVLYHVADFHYNSDMPNRRVRAEGKFTSLLVHVRETKKAAGKGEFWIDKLLVYKGDDTQAPTAPAELAGKRIANNRIELTWKPATDNAAVVLYNVFRKVTRDRWRKIGETVGLRYVDPLPGTSEAAYCVTASDFENNCSQPSNVLDAGASKAGPVLEMDDPMTTDRLRYAGNVRKIHAAGAGKVRRGHNLFHGDSITAASVYTYTLGGHLLGGTQIREGYGRMKTGFAKSTIDKFLAKHKPEFAVIMFGTNDGKRPAGVTGSMENLSYVIDACAKFGTVPILATIPPRGFDKARQSGQEHYNAELIKLCRAKRVPISYCYEEMIARDLRQMLGDGVHLKSTTGNQAAGRALWLTYRQILWALRDTSDTMK